MEKSPYVLMKARLKWGVPYLAGYNGNPHFVIVLENQDGTLFKLVVNAKSNVSVGGEKGSQVLYQWNRWLRHPMLDTLKSLAEGLHTKDFPRLDYVHDRELVDLEGFRPVPTEDPDSENDINDILSEMLDLDKEKGPFDYTYHGKSGSEVRKAWAPHHEVWVYGFGMLFEPLRDGLHETHMNQGNPVPPKGSRQADHSKENGPFQDGAVFVEKNGVFQGFFTAFQTQCVPTDSRGRPIPHVSRPMLHAKEATPRRRFGGETFPQEHLEGSEDVEF